MANMMKGLFGGKKTKTPKTVATPVMPVEDDAAVQAAQLAEQQKRQNASGRMSTILTDSTQGGADSLG
jgi:hypothetical protein